MLTPNNKLSAAVAINNFCHIIFRKPVQTLQQEPHRAAAALALPALFESGAAPMAAGFQLPQRLEHLTQPEAPWSVKKVRNVALISLICQKYDFPCASARVYMMTSFLGETRQHGADALRSC
eukprot:4781193-Pleurochrysis_carterae.AAC.4